MILACTLSIISLFGKLNTLPPFIMDKQKSIWKKVQKFQVQWDVKYSRRQCRNFSSKVEVFTSVNTKNSTTRFSQKVGPTSMCQFLSSSIFELNHFQRFVSFESNFFTNAPNSSQCHNFFWECQSTVANWKKSNLCLFHDFCSDLHRQKFFWGHSSSALNTLALHSVAFKAPFSHFKLNFNQRVATTEHY